MLDLHEGILREFAERAATSFDDDIKAGLLRGTKARDAVAENQQNTERRKQRKSLGLCTQCGDPAAVNTGHKNRGELGKLCAVCVSRTVKKAA